MLAWLQPPKGRGSDRNRSDIEPIETGTLTQEEARSSVGCGPRRSKRYRDEAPNRVEVETIEPDTYPRKAAEAKQFLQLTGAMRLEGTICPNCLAASRHPNPDDVLPLRNRRSGGNEDAGSAQGIGCACVSTPPRKGVRVMMLFGVLVSTTFPLLQDLKFAHDLPHPSWVYIYIYIYIYI